ncbi:MAG: hypothetical protein WC307_06200 [Candidatus Nanoarchaeia archaeon]|jgi:ribosomal protein L34E
MVHVDTYYCYLCGKDITGLCNHGNQGILRLSKIESDGKGIYLDELCDDCYKELLKLVQRLKEAKQSKPNIDA